MRQQPNRKKKDTSGGGYPFVWTFMLWGILMGVILFYSLQMYRDVNVADIAYSTFKQQVRKDNVSEVLIQGQKINGKFRSSYTVVEDRNGDEQSQTYDVFRTVKPPVTDQGLLPLLEEHNVRVDAEPSDGSGWWNIIWLILPWVLIIGFFSLMRRNMQQQMKGGMEGGGLFGINQSRAKRFDKSKSNVSYDDVAGLENSKKELSEVVDYLREPKKFRKLGAEMPRGILLVGPPGTGKTLLARATAGEADVPFFSISGSEFIEMFVGVGASRVRDMFKTAKKEAPSIIFIDELDSIGRSRGTGLGGGHDEREQTLNQILSEMDGFDPHESVVVMAATNRPDVLDAALTRPGRFDRRITLDMPWKKAREKILAIHTKDVPLEKDVDLAEIAAMTVGFSGAELHNLVNEPALLAGRHDRDRVSKEDFYQARDKIMMGTTRDERITDKDREVIAYHEAGHTLVAYMIPETDPLQKVSIIPRGRALGATEQIPEQDKFNLSREYLRGRIAVMLGGRSAEKLIFNDVTTGAANDLQQVTRIARHMVTRYGMSDRLGAAAFSMDEEHVFLGKDISKPKHFSEYTNRIIDEEIQAIIDERERTASQILSDNREKLVRLADALLDRETLEKQDIEAILDESGASNRET